MCFGLGMGPLDIELVVPKGVETTVERTIGISNSATKSIHVTLMTSGDIEKWVRLDPPEVNLPPGPGPDSQEARPYTRVRLIFTVPRDITPGKYKGEVVAKEEPVGGGVLAAGVSLSTAVTISVGQIGASMFPIYVNVLVAILILMIFLQVFIIPVWRRR
jgi:hypothetical protein